MSEHYIPPPPYELSLQRDQRISEELQELELSKRRPTEGEEDSGEWGDNKDSKVLDQKASMEVIVKPLRVQKRPAASNNAAVRGPRPLPQRPPDAGLRSLQGQGNRPRCKPMPETKAQETEQNHMGETYSLAPPSFSAIGPPLVGPPYERSMLHPNTSAAPSLLNSPLQPSFDASRQSHTNHWPLSRYSLPEPRTETSFRRTSHAPLQSTSSSIPPRDRNFAMRLAFDPSVAYSNFQADAVTETREMGATALYSSAVSSHLDPGSRQSHM
ncbi:hypothetical protein PAXRUDRAFT_824311 [Paxillus rubicundulus Ve08.2h10]|uniref:Uncharacterized protein n=1 Tax=Paxillus rubicundulus Ve08.2h10 TaxID=930991 RepID=A0A0D0E7X3_9AGAM|nr:hypothetical protein PAXRUDRAFT_824311 [Paxillus rubicundulus Ve08.2h10]